MGHDASIQAGAVTPRHEGPGYLLPRGVARVTRTLRVEFFAQDHAVGRAFTATFDRLVADCAGRIAAGGESGAIPPGLPPWETALAYLCGLERLVSRLAGHVSYDVDLADWAVRGVFGFPTAPLTTGSHGAGACTPPAHTTMEDHR